MDGTGFPDGLRAADIPREARIVAVVDAFDAMTTNRAYRPSRTTGRRGGGAAALRGHPLRSPKSSTLSSARSRTFPSSLSVSERSAPPSMSDTLMISVSGMRGHRRHGPHAGARRPTRCGARRLGAPRLPSSVPRSCLGRDARTSGPMFAHAADGGSDVGGRGCRGPRDRAHADRAARGRASSRRRGAHPHGEPQSRSNGTRSSSSARTASFSTPPTGERVRALAEQGPPRAGWDGIGQLRTDPEAVRRHLDAILGSRHDRRHRDPEAPLPRCARLRAGGRRHRHAPAAGACWAAG